MGMWTVRPEGGISNWNLSGGFAPVQNCVVGCWFRLLVGTTTWENLFNQRDGLNTSRFGLYIEPSGSVYWQTEAPGALYSTAHVKGTQSAVNLGEWYFSIAHWSATE